MKLIFCQTSQFELSRVDSNMTHFIPLLYWWIILNYDSTMTYWNCSQFLTPGVWVDDTILVTPKIGDKLFNPCSNWSELKSILCFNHQLPLLYFLLSDKSLNSNSYSKTYRYPTVCNSTIPVTLQHTQLKESGICHFTYTDTILTALILHILFKTYSIL